MIGEPPRFDLDALRNLAGDKVFDRGLAYHQAGQVAILVIEPERVVARVSGSEDCRAVLTGSGTSIGGECSCRACARRSPMPPAPVVSSITAQPPPGPTA